MPTYEYQCDSCHYRFERFQPMTAEAIKVCPQCQSSVRRLIGGGAGIIFKGSGFYQTDYRSPSYQKKAEAEKKTIGSQITENKVQKTEKETCHSEREARRI